MKILQRNQKVLQTAVKDWKFWIMGQQVRFYLLERRNFQIRKKKHVMKISYNSAMQFNSIFWENGSMYWILSFPIWQPCNILSESTMLPWTYNMKLTLSPLAIFRIYVIRIQSFGFMSVFERIANLFDFLSVYFVPGYIG